MTVEKKSGETEDEELDRLVRALGHPSRIEILRFMARHGPSHEINPRAFADEAAADLNTYAYHFRVLARCKAIKLVYTGSARGAESHFYVFNIDAPWALTALGLAELAQPQVGSLGPEGRKPGKPPGSSAPEIDE